MDLDADRAALDAEKRRGRDGGEHGCLPWVRDAHRTREGKPREGSEGDFRRGVRHSLTWEVPEHPPL
jgi:hypothetical protein